MIKWNELDSRIAMRGEVWQLVRTRASIQEQTDKITKVENTRRGKKEDEEW